MKSFESYDKNRLDDNAIMYHVKMITDQISKNNEKIDEMMCTDLGEFVVNREVLLTLSDSLIAVMRQQDVIMRYIKHVARD